MIPAAIEKASFTDCFHKDGTCIENKIFFLKNYFSNKMEGYYRVVDGTGNDTFYIKEVQKLLVLGLIFLLKPVVSTSDYVIKLVVERATEFDFFCKDELLRDVIFYVDSQSSVSGPFNSNQYKPERIKEGLKNGYIYIPSKKQTFEQIENKQIA